MTAPKATALLRDVFRLTNRGTVLVADAIEGDVRIGDRLLFEGRETRVIGIEMVSVSSPDASVGLLVHDADDENLRALIGQRMVFHGAA